MSDEKKPKNILEKLKEGEKDKNSQEESNIKNILEMEDRAKAINDVSPSFCTAKWLQSTVLLHNGQTHSCHHPPQHKIPLEEIKDNPSALHNTKYKKALRNMMLEGKRPKECQYCWNIEDLPDAHYSDRIYKSTDLNWSFPHLEKVVNLDPKDNINPTYLEIAFDNTCNFKCAYCTPDISTTWMDEIKKFGPYPTRFNTGDLDWIKKTGKMPYHHSEENPYVEAFWKWWPELYQDLQTFRITGGEPLLNQNTWKVLEFIASQPRNDFNLAINSNMGIQRKWVEKLLGYTQKITPNISTLEIYTSCEAVGKQAEYIRHGLDYNLFLENIKFYMDRAHEKDRINFMITFNALSLTTFTEFLDDIGKLRKKYNPNLGFNRFPIMIAYLRWPSYLSMRILPKEIKEKYNKIFREYAEKNSIDNDPQNGFIYLEEVDQINRLCDYMMSYPTEEELSLDKKDFGTFIKEYDFRKNLDFKSLFPEYSDFYDECLSL